MNVLTIDIGGTNIKILATGQREPRKFPSGPALSPRQMVDGVKKLAADWKYDVVSIGYPGVVVKNRILTEPHNLAKGWVGFNFKAAFRRPVKIINDAAMQALGSYKKGQKREKKCRLMNRANEVSPWPAIFQQKVKQATLS